ncbi:MAG: hypothetical protein K9K66_11090 [Desulfarculaceae bacterium]|nr:hypothetical protein [Desulfarculaceae bacterium]MCF8070755.1 hypothetical protein [Desulfarculaceae bacterium]MCF8102192.1 hypothetical protein [Desulfarculaceae bacterium]MCF8117009.1 hypothetical protein [Desulfarculaceae bacterium]
MAGRLPRCLIWPLLLLLLFCMTAAGPAFASQSPQSITVAIGEDYPPFNAVDDQGRPWGWLVDIK